jgi:hypothetical protein
MNQIVERIERELGMAGLADLLAKRLAPTDLQSLLLEVYRVRSGKRLPADVLASYESDRFARPSTVSPQRLLAWEQTAFSQLPPEFRALELSPVCPLGTSSAIAGVSQDWAVATARNTEVVSDSTNVLALESALRRKKLLRGNPKSVEPVHLAASHRLLRAQRFTGPNQVTHFSLFALCSAGRDPGGRGFEVLAFRLHILFYLKALRAFLGEGARLRLGMTDFSGKIEAEWMETELLAPFRMERVECMIEESRTHGKGYYPGLCFHIFIESSSGEILELADGGAVDWTQRLLGNAKERLVISGIGSERVCEGI